MKTSMKNKLSPSAEPAEKAVPRTSVRETKPRSEPSAQPTLRFTPYAWAKLIFFRDEGETEVGGLGVCETDDLLLVTDIAIVKQNVTAVSVEFDDESVADHLDHQVDLGRSPEQCLRIWIHTHPGDSPQPSVTDEECLRRVFGQCDWALMFILGRGGKTYARLRFNAGPGGQIAIPVEVDYSAEFAGSDHAGWMDEYRRNVRAHKGLMSFGRTVWEDEPGGLCFADEWIEELEEMEPDERQAVLAELQGRPDLWEKEDIYV